MFVVPHRSCGRHLSSFALIVGIQLFGLLCVGARDLKQENTDEEFDWDSFNEQYNTNINTGTATAVAAFAGFGKFRSQSYVHAV